VRMRQAILSMCLIVLLSSTGICYGDTPPATPKTTRLESLPFISSSGVVINSSTQPGHYLGRPISRGLQIGPTPYSRVTIPLGGRYETLAGVVYVEDGEKGAGSFSLVGVGTHGNSSSLFSASLAPKKEEPFTISIKGITSLSLATAGSGWFDVVADLTIGSTPTPQAPSGPQVIVRYPTGGAGVAADSKVLFAWQPFPHALNYVLQIWLIRPSGSTMITNRSLVTMTTLIYHATAYTWDNHGFLPGVYQYDLIPLDANGNALAARSNPQQITLAS
jgi:hypothetical protein